MVLDDTNELCDALRPPIAPTVIRQEGGLSNRVDGTLIDVLNTEDPALIAILVELDEGDIIGSTDVVVTFDPEVLRCIEGRDATREDLRPGIDVRAQRVDSDEVDASDPPAVRAIDVAVRCDD